MRSKKYVSYILKNTDGSKLFKLNGMLNTEILYVFTTKQIEINLPVTKTKQKKSTCPCNFLSSV